MKNTILRTYLIFALSVFAGASAFVNAQPNLKDESTVYNNQGVAQMEAGKYEAAVESFNRAISLCPTYATAFYHLGVAFFRLKQFEKALDALEKAAELNSSHSSTHNQL